MVSARLYCTFFAQAFYILEWDEEGVLAYFVDPKEGVKKGLFLPSELEYFELDGHFTPQDMTEEDMVAYERKFWGVAEARKRKPKCPLCGGKDIIPVGYGLPDREAVERLAGKVYFWGCIVPPYPPKWYCKGCKHFFGRKLPK